MALYIIVHHFLDPKQPWQNNWLDQNEQDASLLDYIFTKPILAQACESERIAGNRVFIHRCKYRSSPRIICASALISAVDLSENQVLFSNHQTLNLTPPIRANQGQIHYYYS